MRVAREAWLLLLCLFTITAAASEPVDTALTKSEVELQEVMVQSSRRRRPATIDSDGSISVDAVTAGQRMRAFGEADALRVLGTLPGVAAGSDYASGISVDGGEFSHTFYGIGGAPVFFPYHFGGIFSVFNAEHFPVVRMEKSAHGADMPGYVGGRIDFSPRPQLARSVRGMVNLGLIAASASVSAPLGEKADITASGRISYLNLIYGKLLRDNTTDMGYGFGDLNLTARYKPTERDLLSVNLFYNRDFLSTDDSRYALATGFHWHNLLAVGEWNHFAEKFRWNQNLYYSSFGSSFGMTMTSINADVRSGIRQFGTRGNGSYRIDDSGRTELQYGAEALYTSALPQQIAVSGYGEGSSSEPDRDNAVWGNLNAAVKIRFTPAIAMTVGSRLSGYFTDNYTKVFVDPFVTVMCDSRVGTFNIHVGGYSQPLHQVGFSDIGLASNFWLTSGRNLPVQRSKVVSASWLYRPGKGDYEFSADLYYKLLSGASEFDGTVITMMNNGYDCFEHILTGEGRNAGAGVMASRVSGRLTGSVAFSYGRALRKFPALGNKWFTAAVEQRLGCTLQLHYKLSRSVALDAVWNYATGRPVTPVEALYMVGENVVSVYGERNSRTLPPYHRLDLSASWNFKLRFLPHVDNSLVVSVLNAYGRRNVSMVTFGYDAEAAVFSRRDVASLYRFLPSIAYTIRF